MPQYKKVFDIGTYTGNGGQYRVGIPTLRGVGPTGTQVAGSTRFRAGASAYLSRTPGSTGNQQKSTISCWAKLPRPTDATYNNMLYAVRMVGSNYWYVGFDGSGRFGVAEVVSSIQYNLNTTRSFKDSSVWTHFVASVDTTQATASNRVKIYIDGVLQTSFSTATYPTQNYTHTYMGTTSYVHAIGWGGGLGGFYGSEYYLSNFYYIDGQQLDALSFGELNSDGIWVPKAYSGTYGTNGFYLPMNSSSNYATDQSGNGNNWTPSGFNVTTANTTYDIMTDSPTDYLSGSMTTANNAGNYATWSPLSGDNYVVSGSAASISNGALDFIANQNVQWASNRSNWIIPTSGKWYFEATLGGSGAGSGTYPVQVGVMLASSAIGTPNPLSGQSYAYMYGSYDGKFYNNNTTSITGSTWASGDVIGIALDIDNGAIYFSKNGTWQNSGSPTSGSSKTGAIFTSGIAGTRFTPCASHAATSSPLTINGGQRAFSYTPPTGYVGLNTYNYPRPADSSLWFYGDTPDLMWIKNRSTTGLHTITDTVRGIGLNLVTSSSAAETSYPAVTEMNKFGMSIINDGTSIVNGSGNSMVYWGWKAGSNTSSTSVTNNDGAVTSQVSVNKLSGFSIVTGTTVSTGGSTFGHGLGVTPDLMITKIRSAGSTDWYVYHSSLGYLKYLLLDSTSSVTTEVTPQTWGTSPTSSVFTLAGNFQGSYNTVTYLWNAVPGYSSFGTYTGNASTDGPFVYLGFRPRWLIIKRTDSTGDWQIYDSTRDSYNVTSNTLYGNGSYAEDSNTTNRSLDLISNGFKLRSSATYLNASSGTYIYAAFAEIPFKFARAR